MRKAVFTCLLIPFLTIKVAFLYRDEARHRFTSYCSNRVEPTYRISYTVYPRLGPLKISAAVSKVDKAGNVTPQMIVKDSFSF